MNKIQCLILIRGLPGSGKSTMAINNFPDFKHVEADMFFRLETGEYKYDPLKIKEAHKWCQERTEYLLSKGYDVVVSNTFIRHWEMLFYKELAHKMGIELRVIICKGDYKNIHNVPESVIAKMRQNWED